MKLRLAGYGLLLVVCAVACAGSCGSNGSGDSEGGSPPALEVGDRFTVDVVSYSRGWQLREDPAAAWTDKVAERLQVEIEVIGREEARGKECLLLEYRAGPDAGRVFRKTLYRVWLTPGDLVMQRVERLAEGARSRPPSLEFAGGISAVLYPPRWFPIEVIDRVARGEESTVEGAIISVSRQESEANGVLRIEQEANNENYRFLVRQTWPSDGKWWTRFERYYDGYKDLEATLLPPEEE